MTRSWPCFGLLLAILSTVSVTRGDEPPAAPIAPDEVHRTVERAIVFLQADCVRWVEEHKCASCHHVPMMVWSFGEAQRQGYAIDSPAMDKLNGDTWGSLEKMIATSVLRDPARPPDERSFANGINMGAVYLALGSGALATLEPNQRESLDQIALHIARKQRDDGSWEFFGNRPPIAECQDVDALLITLALQAQLARGDLSEDLRARTVAALEKAGAWLTTAQRADSHQAKVLRLLFDVRAGKPPEQWKAAADDIGRMQRDDGGWSQTPEMQSDALATGQSLYVLSLSGWKSDLPAMKRGVSYLLRTQTAIGNWTMTSRPTLDGKSGPANLLVPITYYGTAWATLGLVRVTPKKL